MKNRLVFGGLLTLLAAGVFYGDHTFGPPFPFLLILSLGLAVLGAIEFGRLAPGIPQPRSASIAAFSAILLLMQWSCRHQGRSVAETLAINFCFCAGTLLALTIDELRSFTPGGQSTGRLAHALLGVLYLGGLASFFVNLRVLQPDARTGTLSLVLAVFVPKGCDIGAYFTGRAIGKHKMSPVLSPNKTWEGAVGGLLTATAVALGVQSYHPIIPGGWVGAAGFGFVVGGVGLLGDLAESMIKRDAGAKDAAALIPGFGGVLDVVDAILFAAPVSFLWLHAGRHWL